MQERVGSDEGGGRELTGCIDWILSPGGGGVRLSPGGRGGRRPGCCPETSAEGCSRARGRAGSSYHGQGRCKFMLALASFSKL